MAASTGKSPLETLKNFSARGWFDKEFKKFSLRIATEYSARDEILDGAVITKGSGTTDADEMNLAVSAGNVKLNGVMSSISAVSNEEAVKGVSSSLEIVVGGVPTISANSNTHETLTVSSAGKNCVIRFYDSSATAPTGYDASGSFATQIDIDLNGLNAAAVALSLQTALTSVFTVALGYSVGTGTTFSVTAPIGSGNDFTYVEEAGLGSIAGTPTAYAYSFGGMINSSGAAVISALNSATTDYYITFIVSNSDGSGAANSTDGSIALIHGVLSGSASYLSTQDINKALLASSGNIGNYDHSAVTGWCHVAEVLFDSNVLAGSEIGMNRNNAVSKS